MTFLLQPGVKYSGLRHGRSVDQYVDNIEPKPSPRARPVPQPRPSLAQLASGRRDQPVAITITKMLLSGNKTLKEN
jgi:hypothetical protein